MAHEAVLSIITIKFNKSPVPHGSKIRRGLRGFEGGVASKRPSEASPDQNLANPVGSYGRTSSVKQNAAREREQNLNTPNLTRVSSNLISNYFLQAFKAEKLRNISSTFSFNNNFQI